MKVMVQYLSLFLVILEYLGGIETIKAVFQTLLDYMILEYLGGIETIYALLLQSIFDEILEYLGGIETKM